MLPSGVITFVFSDIEGSTRLWEMDPAGMRRSLARHDQLVRTVIEDAGGLVFKHTGDGVGAAFESVSAGVRAAADVATALSTEQWTGPTLSCRIGVHSGEAESREGDFFGSTVTRTARLMDAGNGGQILVSEAARRLLGDGPPDGWGLVDVGEHRLKDLGEPMRVYRLVGPGADDDRELRTLERAPHNFPIQLSTFVGRESEIKEVTDLVRHSRLVTLTGIGGIGKTRLSLQVAAELLADFRDGAWQVELAPLTEPGLIPDTAVNALGIPQDSSLSAIEQLLEFLGPRSALLVIDNCEHLIDDVAAFVETLLRASPDLHVLATSREGLAVTGETLWRVPSLRVDDDAAAVELFAERARLVQPGFAVNDGNRRTVADLCVRLDGIPLAIELATARLKMLSMEQIAQHLDDRFRLLTGGSRTAVERQRTLKAMMDWSYDLLGENEQALLRRLAVFYDGFIYEAAERVCSGETLAPFEILDLLGRLVEASMVSFETEPRPRYRLLETVRQYSLDKLFESGEADEARLRHAEHFRTEAAEIGDALQHGDFSAMDIATDDLGNYRAAMTWSLESQHASIALELATSLRPYFWNRVMYRESLRWVTAALDIVEDTDSPAVPRAVAYGLTDAGNVADSSLIPVMRRRAERLLDGELDGGSRGLLMNALAADVLIMDLARADELFAEAATLLRSAGDPHWSAPVQNRFMTAIAMGSTAHRDELLELVDHAEAEGTAIHGTVVRVAFTLIDERYDEVLETVERVDPVDEWEATMLLSFKAAAQMGLGATDAALASISRLASVPGTFADALIGWQAAFTHLQRGDLEKAIESFMAPNAYDPEIPNLSERANAAWFWAVVAERRDQFEEAAELLGFARSMSERTSARPLAADQRLIDASSARVLESLGSTRFGEIVEAGMAADWADLPLVHG